MTRLTATSAFMPSSPLRRRHARPGRPGANCARPLDEGKTLIHDVALQPLPLPLESPNIKKPRPIGRGFCEALSEIVSCAAAGAPDRIPQALSQRALGWR